MRVPRDDLVDQLTDQRQLLRASCASFDGGVTAEAKRIAVALRILFHHGGSSKALLEQLGVRSSLRYATNQEPADAERSEVVANDVISQEQADRINATLQSKPSHTMSTGLVGAEVGEGGGTYWAPLGDLPFWLSFEEWWHGEALSTLDDGPISRWELVRDVANTDGGAHVDAELREVYSRLTRSNSLGLEAGWNDDVNPLGNPVPFAIRQIAHEVETTLEGLPAVLLR